MAKIWPLTFSWSARSFSKIKFGRMSQLLPCPQFGLEKPVGLSDEMIVAEVEREANVLLGGYNNKEHKAILVVVLTVAALIVVSLKWGQL